jgi:Protein of unknown function (DUF3105)
MWWPVVPGCDRSGPAPRWTKPWDLGTPVLHCAPLYATTPHIVNDLPPSGVSDRNADPAAAPDCRARRPRVPAVIQRGAPTRVTRLLVVVAVGLLALSGCMSSSKSGATGTSVPGGVGLPKGTSVFPETDHTHTTDPVTYDRTPPAGGAHNPVWQNCGIYEQPIPNEHGVHSLEHGTVWITYQPSLPAAQVAQLRQLVTTHYDGSQRYLLLSPYPGLRTPVVASAWGAQLALPSPTDPRLLQFVEHFQGGDQGGEQGAYCTGGYGTPVG